MCAHQHAGMAGVHAGALPGLNKDLDRLGTGCITLTSQYTADGIHNRICSAQHGTHGPVRAGTGAGTCGVQEVPD